MGKRLLLFSATGLLSSFCFAGTNIATWELSSSAATSQGTPTVAEGISATQLKIYVPPLVAGQASANSWQVSGWSTNAADQNFTGALSQTNYWEWSLTVGGDYQLTLDGISRLLASRGTNGPGAAGGQIGLLYSTNNFTTFSLAGTNSAAIGTSSTPGTSIAELGSSWTASPLVVNGGQTITFRLVCYGASSTNGTFRIVNNQSPDIIFTGTVTKTNLSAKSITWNGGSSGTWDRTVSSWYVSSPASPVAFADGDNVTFNISSATSVSVPANLSAGSIVAKITSGQGLQLAGAGVLSSPSALTASGGGTLTLGVPTALGAIQLSSGQLVASANNALSGNLSTAAGTTLDIGTTSHSSLGSVSFGKIPSGTGSLTASLGYTLTVDEDSTLSASLAGAGGMKKDGAGKLTVAGAQTYLGNINLNSGVLETSGSERLPDTAVVVFGGGTTLRLGGNETLMSLSAISTAATATVDLQSYNLTLTATSSNQFQGALIGAGSLIRQGTSILSLGENNTFSGGTVLKEGSLRLQASGIRSTNSETGEVSLVSGPFGTGALTLQGGKIYSSSTNSRSLYNPIKIQGDFTLGDSSASGNGDINVSTNVTGASTVLSSNATLTILSPTDWYQSIVGTGKSLTKTGAAMLRLRGANQLDSLQVLAGELHSQNSNNLATVVAGGTGILGWGYSNIVGPCAYFGTATVVLSNGATFGQYGSCGSNNETADRTLANKLRVQGDVTLGLGTYTSYLSGDIDLTGTSRTLTLSNSAIFNGSVSNGTLRLVSTSPTRFLALGGSNQFSGVLNLGGGLLVLSNQHALQGITQILFNGNSTNGGTLGLTASNNADYSAIFSSADLQNYRIDTGGVDSTLATSLGSTNGTFSKSGLGTLTLPVANLFSGGATLAGGRLALGHNQALGTGEFLVDQSGVEIEALVPLTLGQDVRLSGSPTLVGNQPITISGVTRVSGGNRAFYPSNTGGLTLNRVELSTSPSNNAYRMVIYGTSPVVVNGPIVDGTNATYPNGIPGGHFRMSNPSTVTFRGTNTYTGPTWLEAGTLIMETTNSLPSDGDLRLNGGILRLAGAGTYRVGNLSGGVDTNTSVVTNEVVTTNFITITNADNSTTDYAFTTTNTNVATNVTLLTNPIGGTIDLGSLGATLRVTSMSNWATNSVLTIANHGVNGSAVYLPTNLTAEQVAAIRNAANPSATASVDSQGLLSFSGSGNTAPVIAAGQSFSVPENSASGTVVGSVAASDAEGNPLSGWTIVSGDPAGAFFITSSGQIQVVGLLNFEAVPVHTLGIQVSDGTSPSAIETITVNVTNVAEFSDVFGAASPSGDANGDGVSNLMAYALGATSSSGSVVKPASATTSSNLSLTAVVRTNDPKCAVVGEVATSLVSWQTNSPILGVPAGDQTGAVPGVSQRQVFSVDRGSDPKKFLRLKATYVP